MEIIRRNYLIPFIIISSIIAAITVEAIKYVVVTKYEKSLSPPVFYRVSQQTESPIVRKCQPPKEVNGGLMNWKVYFDPWNCYFIKYPRDLTTDGNGPLIFKDQNGKSLNGSSEGIRATYEYEKTLEQIIQSQVEGGFRVQEAKLIAIEKIIDDEKTLGYFSQWEITFLGGEFGEKIVKDRILRADFEAKTYPIYDRPIISFVISEDGSLDPELFRRIVGTFGFTE